MEMQEQLPQPPAFEEMYADKIGWLTRFAQQRGMGEDAEDAAQEVMLRAWRQPNFDTDSPCQWLVTVCKNYAIDQHRLRRPVIDESVTQEDAEQIPDAHDEYRGVLLRGVIRTALGGLSHEHKQVLELLYLKGMTTGEVAEKTGIANGTVRSRSFYAKAAARVLLAEQGIASDDLLE